MYITERWLLIDITIYKLYIFYVMRTLQELQECW